MEKTAKLVPVERWEARDLRDSLLSYLDHELEALEVAVGGGLPMAGVQMSLLLPVLVDAGVFVDNDGLFYVFDMHEDHDPEDYSPPTFDLREDSELLRLSELLREQIENASKDQIVRYQRWADNMTMR